MPNKILFTNSNKKAELTDTSNRYHKAIQSAHVTFQALGLDKKLSLQELLAIGNPEEWVRDFIYESNQILKSLPFAPEEAKKLIQLPATFKAFEDAHQGARGILKHSPAGSLPGLTHFTITDNNEVEALPSLIAWIAAQTEVRTISDEEDTLLAELTLINEKLQDIHERFPALVLVGSNQSEAILDQYYGEITFKPINIKNIR